MIWDEQNAAGIQEASSCKIGHLDKKQQIEFWCLTGSGFCMSYNLSNRESMSEPSLGVLNSRRSTDLLSVRRDQPTAWRRLALDFLTFCHNKRIGAPEADVQKSKTEVLSDAWKLDFQMRKWELGMERWKADSDQQGQKRRIIDSLEGKEDVEEAARALETARGQRRAYDRCVALKVGMGCFPGQPWRGQLPLT